MRTFNRALGIVSILWGIVQWRWNVWAFSASWHLGSPLRRADLPLVTDDSVQPKIFAEVIQTGMQVIHVLDRTLDLLVVDALVFIGLGIFLLWSSNKYERA